jgi:membrane-anchored protein YejM (alkaline phosphatase superfamily)
MPLAYHHTPMIFHYPAVVPVDMRKQLALQIDLFPTMMGILQLPYINNTMGVDLLKERRPFAYFSADSRLACLNETHYLIMNKRGKAALYHYPSRSLKNEIDERKALADSMKTYVFSMLQTTQWLIDNRKTGLQQSKTGK